ncbi:lisH domain and HEAT repeat-containing protein KIAA1468 isoform X2 [Cephus cinctus]|nr:lisH domain and HEAT repeat-containing protein KIAA1468 isoform X2 [Cephus cinctus]
MTRYSEDGGGVDERVAILEFELRKAKESISALRANLTVVTESENTTPDKSSEKQNLNDLPIKPHEQRALNFLINEYLLGHAYKLTSITFSDENENQDFEDWDDVGLNISRPPELLQIYREFIKSSGHERRMASASVAVQTDPVSFELNDNKEKEITKLMEEVERLKEEAQVMEQDRSELQELLTATRITTDVLTKDGLVTIETTNSNSTTPDKFELLESPPQDISTTTQEPEEEDSASVAVSLGETDPGDREWTRLQVPILDVTDSIAVLPNSPSRYLPSSFKKEVLALCMMTSTSSARSIIEEPLKEGISKDTVTDILAYSLPRIVPNVILNKREEVIPLILTAIRLHMNAAEREKLLQLLFNLKKRPQEEERRIILAGLVAIAKLRDAQTEGEEIINQCWEQSQHKHPERRLLAAECCSSIAPYASSNVRNSLILSMLQQMLLEDKDPAVRAAVVRSLGLLVAFMDDPDKYFQCEELILTALEDVSSLVVDTATSVLLPILAQWALSLKRLQSHLLPRIIVKLKNQLRSSTHQQHSPAKDNRSDADRIQTSIAVLQCLVPHTVVCVADAAIVHESIQEEESQDLPASFLTLCRMNLINPIVFYDGEVDVVALLNTFFANAWENDSWPELEWLTEKLIPDLVEIVKSLEVNQDVIFNAFLTYLQSLCLGFGRYITQTRIQPVFASEVSQLEKQLTALTPDKGQMSLTLFPAYLMAVSTLEVKHVVESLKRFIVALSMNGVSIVNLQVAVVRLCKQPNMLEHILGALWDGVVHQRPSVRCATAVLFSAVVAHVPERLANARITPAIVTLASDSEVTVRAASIPALGRLATECTAREARDKARLTLETIAREPQGVPPSLAVPLVSTLATIAPNCPQNYVEDVIATQLAGITASALQQPRKTDLVNALVEAYCVLVYCPLGSQCINGVLLPGLKYLETLVNQVLPQQKEAVRSLLREAESHQELPKLMERTSSTSSGLSLSMATANVGQGVEDMRQRMSKMFQQKTNSSSMPSMPSIFRKK